MMPHHETIAGHRGAVWVLVLLCGTTSLAAFEEQDTHGVHIASVAKGRVAGERSTRHEAENGFDVGDSHLSVPFRGNSVEWVLRFGTLAPRMGFESDADYAARRRSFRSEVFAFVPDHFETRYDDANETIVVTLSPSFECSKGQPVCTTPAFDIHRTKLIQKSRAGPAQWTQEQRPTASERSAVIATIRAWKQTQLVATDAEGREYRQPLMFSLTVPRHSAKRTKSTLAVALVCAPKLQQPPSTLDALVPEATSIRRELDGADQLQDESTTYYVALRVTLLQAWLVDRSTGTVFGRFTPQGMIVPTD